MLDAPEHLQTALVDRYRLERELGRGGMVTVYLAQDLKHRRPVALKIFHPDLAAQVGSSRFHREVEIAAPLSHPHILTLIDSGVADGVLFYTMPFVGGESLRARLRREAPLPIGDAVRIALDIAGALAYAHGQGIVHRDIKPENVMLHEGEAMVTDFGIAKALSAAGAEALTQIGLIVGTPAYMSPEQAAGESVDGRSDVYSLACVLFEMLTGEQPFGGSTLSSLARRMSEPPPSARARREEVSAALDRAALGWGHYFGRRYEDAIAQCRRALELDPHLAVTHLWLGVGLEQAGATEEAIAAYEEGVRLSREEPLGVAFLGHGLAKAGRADDARRRLAELREMRTRRYVSAYDIAVIHAGLGEVEPALDLLEQGFQECTHWMALLGVDPRLDPLRSNGRFRKLLGALGLG